MSSWGAIIRAARDERGWSQAELADLLGVSQPTIAAWEKHGPNRTKAETRDRLAKILGIEFVNEAAS